MLINNAALKEVKFISYTGEYPNLCSGVLTLSVQGKEYIFGHSFNQYPIFWSPGGDCGFNCQWESYCYKSEWVIDCSKLPTELQRYAFEINEVFNFNVPFGCCGGCL